MGLTAQAWKAMPPGARRSHRPQPPKDFALGGALLPPVVTDMHCTAFRDAMLPPRNKEHVDPWMRNRSLEPWLARRGPLPRVFDAFIFAGETELLETRLHVLQDVVDTFVFIEADQSFSGLKRSLVFSRFRPSIQLDASRVWYEERRASSLHACNISKSSSWQCQRCKQTVAQHPHAQFF